MAGFLVAKVNPKFLHSNSTSHTWPFSAIAELIDNAYDPDVSASQLWIDKEDINGKECLTFVDDGKGMDLDHLHKMLSLGYCEKDRYETGSASHKPIGQYGNGFKSGSMRLAKDALVLTVHKEAATACVGLLSQTLCSHRNLDTVILPVMEFTLPDLERSGNAVLDMDRSLKAILEVSPYSNEDELKEELRKINKQKHGSGTKIVLFNLKWNKNGMSELDFESVPNDIRNPETQDDDPESSCQQTKVPMYRQSLRRYCSILFLTPKMEIFIRKERVQSFVIKETLSRPSTMKYRPRGKNETEITFGRRSRRTEGFLEDYGMMLYHRNRLIRPYVKLGCQTKEQTDDSRVGEVVGVVDVCDIIQPTHNKQEFLVNTVEYRTAMSALAKKLDQYCSQIDHHGDTEDEDRDITWNWVQCDRCMKWRRLPTFASEPVPNPWYCHMNPDLTKNRCDFPEEEFSDKETDTTRTPGSSSKSSSRGRGRGGRGRSRGSKSSAVLHSDRSDSGNDASEQEESDSVPATAAPTTPATTSQGEVRCDFPEEEFSDKETDTTRTPGSSSKSSSRGRGRGGHGRSRGSKSSAVLHSDRSDSGNDASEQEESDSVPATTPATTSQGPEVDSPRKRKQPASQRTVGGKRARSNRDPDPPITVTGEPDPAERMYPGLTTEAQSTTSHGEGGRMKSATEAQFGTDQSEPEVIPAESTASQSVGSRSPPGVSAGDVSPCTAPRDGDVTGDGHPGDGRASRRHDDTADDVMGQEQVTSKSFSSDKGCNGQGSNDQGSNRQASTSHHAPSVVTVDDPGVSGHDEDDDTGDTRDQAAEIEQLRRFRRNVHALLRVLVDRQTPDLPDVGPLEEIEDYIQRVLTSLRPPLE